jgi:hypothetical protein
MDFLFFLSSPPRAWNATPVIDWVAPMSTLDARCLTENVLSRFHLPMTWSTG